MGTKVMLITGSNSGIGNAVAKQAVEAGFIVYGGARRREAFAAVEAVGAKPLLLDVTQEESMQSAVRTVEAQHGAVDVLINNAGYGQMGPIELIAYDQWLRQYQTNVFGLVRLAQLVIPAMRQRRRGRILNLSSMGGEFTFPLAGAYHSTKYAVESINDALRFELKGFGIDVVSIQPGPVKTPLAETAMHTLQSVPDTPYRDIMAAFHRVSQRSMGYSSPERVAQVILRAAAAEHPRPRYRIGMMAHVMPRLRRLLSDRSWDGLVARFYA